MKNEITGHGMLKCDSCGKEISEIGAKYLSVKMCCSVSRVPLCKDCWEKISNPDKK